MPLRPRSRSRTDPMKTTIPSLLLSLLAAGCGGDTEVAWKLCTDFGGSTTTHCNGTVVVIVHDAEEPSVSSFQVTVRRLELLQSGSTYTFFEGARRENLLEFVEGGFLLGKREDVPEVEFDAIRLDLTDLAVSPVSGAGYRIAKSPVVVRIEPPLAVSRSSASSLRIDIDVRASLAGAGLSGEVIPVVIASGNEPEARLSVSYGRVTRLDPGRQRFLFEASPEAGTYRASIPDGSGLSLGDLVPGSEVVLEGGSFRGGELHPMSVTLVTPKG